MFERIAQFVFRFRNALFPIVVGAIMLWQPPVAMGSEWGNSLWFIGVLLVGLGQSLRVITIGLDYIKRGGKGRRFFAPRLVTGGIFAHCRNPMYVGNLLLATGLFVTGGNLLGIALGTGFFVVMYAFLIHGEEQYLHGRFGDEFAAYCASTPRWGVRLRGLISTLSHPFDKRRIFNKEYGTLYISLMAPAGILTWKMFRTNGWSSVEPYLFALILYGTAVTIAYGVVRTLKKMGRLNPPQEQTQDQSVESIIENGRARINKIDRDLLDLFNARAREVRKIYDAKNKGSVPRFDGRRTAEILTRICEANDGPLSDEEVERLFHTVLDVYLAFASVSESESDSSPVPRPANDTETTPIITIINNNGKRSYTHV